MRDPTNSPGDGTRARRLNVAIVGGGKGCESILKMVEGDTLGRFLMRVVGVADIDPQAVGVRYAREIGVPYITTDYRELYEIPELKLIIELTGKDEVRDEIERTRPRNIRLIDHYGARLFWELRQAEESIIRQRTEMQKKVEAERESIRETREYLQNILDNSPVIIVTTDMDANIVSFNRGAERSLGYKAEEVIGKPATMFYQDPTKREEFMRMVRSGKAVRDYSYQLLRKDGTLLPVSITLSQLRDSSGKMIGTVGMSKDISHRESLMAQILQSERMAAVGRLASGVAHEINNPLAIISEIAGFLNELAEDESNVDQDEIVRELKEALPKIHQQIKRGRDITHRLLSFARKTEVPVEHADVNAALDEILPFLEKEARLAGIAIHRDYQPDLPRVAIEETQLQEIFMNFIRNAIDALAGGSGGNIWLATQEDDGKVVISVRDDGPGIDDSIRGRLFDPFVSTKSTGQGTGLGLTICYAIVKRFDGEIRVISEPGKGADFKVFLPAHEPTKKQ